MICHQPLALWLTVAAVLLLAPLMSAAGAPATREAPSSQAVGDAAPLWVYVGTYTGPTSKGVYLYRFDPATGALQPRGLAGEVENPSFLAIHPNRKLLYAVGELSQFHGKKGGAVSAFAIDPGSGKLTLLNQQSSGGGGTCFATVDNAGKNVLVANYGAGSVAVLPLDEDGKLKEASALIQHHGSGPDPKRQKEPHAHSIILDPANRFALSADLGMDKVLVYRFDPAAGALTPNDPPAGAVAPGAGPRHLAFHPSGKYLYVVNEMASTVTAFRYDSQKGSLTEIASASTLPSGADGADNSSAEIQIHPSGKFLYASNRGHDSIAVFAIDQATGKLKAIEQEPSGGKSPRNFRIDPTGAFLIAANQKSDNLVVFRIDPNTGALTPSGQTADAPSPVCVKFLPVQK